ncbi:MAG: 16S rRNA (cytosine(1402)-N(4))-methyltransferase RsmH [Bacteroidetes bacterium]|nr:16S rRNA (cytosine(1402)-N(4))-methyltransferase RsmH [Bacteroidota bacterium]MCL1968004.1 16S rRNA (cytosine(1402)-N(4))-methyltransferase RsmH [Bacteroidota bacterium]
MYHQPVLLQESIAGLINNPDGIYVDVTYGGGGHSREILNQLSPNGKLLGFDQDKDAAKNALQDPRFQFVQSNFKHLKKFLQFYKVYPVDGILGDLGVSSHQFDEPSRGFSYRFDEPLDMRMDTTKGTTAADIINTSPNQKLAKLLFAFGEVQNAHKIAALIEKARQINPIQTTGQLVEAIMPVLPKGKENKTLSQIFQALRIEVNAEIEALQSLLEQSTDALKPRGRIAIISYHSLEDRLVKNFFKTGNIEGKLHKDFYGNPLTPFKLITKKAIVPTEQEIEKNPRARSAKLRIAEKVTSDE